MQKSLPITLTVGIAACGDNNTASNVTSPGESISTGTRILEAGAQMLQNKSPIERINTYLHGFHFYNGRMEGRMEAHHYCAILNEELIQCVICDDISTRSAVRRRQLREEAS